MIKIYLDGTVIRANIETDICIGKFDSESELAQSIRYAFENKIMAEYDREMARKIIERGTN